MSKKGKKGKKKTTEGGKMKEKGKIYA